MTTPLEGVRVLDWTIWQQGPIASVLLADMGAEVIKIEPPEGEAGRGMHRMLGMDMPLGFYFHNQNRGKKSIVLNLQTDKAKEVLYRLVEKSDVFVTNFLEPVAQKLKVDYETLKQYNSKLIYGYCSGWGSQGPDARKPSADFTGQARGGIWSISSGADGSPVPVGGGFADEVGGVMMAYALVLALYVRERTGIGQKVEASLLGGQIEMGRLMFQIYLLTGKLPASSLMLEARSPLWYIYKCKDDRWIALAMLQPDRFWHNFCEVLGIQHLEKDPRFENQLARGDHLSEILPTIRERFQSKPRDEWVKLCEEAGLIVAPMHNYAEVANDPQVIANEYIVEVDDPVRGKVKMAGIPIKLSKTPGKVRALAPELGQHTEEVLTQICGYSWEEIAKLREEGVY